MATAYERKLKAIQKEVDGMTDLQVVMGCLQHAFLCGACGESMPGAVDKIEPPFRRAMEACYELGKWGVHGSVPDFH